MPINIDLTSITAVVLLGGAPDVNITVDTAASVFDVVVQMECEAALFFVHNNILVIITY